MRKGVLRTVSVLGMAYAVAGTCTAASAASELATGTASGLPVPRFVSLKSDKVNVRGGPTKDHEVAWVYTRAGLPVEVTAEFEVWRRIRDWEGAEGWVYHSLLSGRRTGVVKPKIKEELVPLHEKPDPESAITAKFQGGVLGSIKRCSAGWCQFSGDKFDGWVEQSRLFGVYPGEKVE